ncbi:hypothetical protein MTR_0230s0070 [Medicago truncatula]|uniref:Uncharacterized protein n=1 Tax=Medicago truncatula TaxID=3880 RepID=A0A072TFL9_MEDTR|nr:hypothetical protein MTR_0230s0070 [Medicago truncatula]
MVREYMDDPSHIILWGGGGGGKYMDDPSHIIMHDKVELKENLSFEVPPMSIED